MFNYEAIDKTPTVLQVEAIINYMEKDPNVKYNFSYMMGMSRTEPNKIILDLNNGHFGTTYEIVFKESRMPIEEIITFKETGSWMS